MYLKRSSIKMDAGVDFLVLSYPLVTTLTKQLNIAQGMHVVHIPRE